MTSRSPIAPPEPSVTSIAPSSGTHAGTQQRADKDIDAAWTTEALRLSVRYRLEIVEGCGLCPWAERTRLDGSIGERVFLQRDPSAVQPSVAAIAELAADPNVKVAFLVYPRLLLTRASFEGFAGQVRVADAAQHPLGEIPFVMAAFHPDAEPDSSAPERLIPFLRRTPDPTLQLLRTAEVDRVRGSAPQGTQFFDTSLFELPFADPPPPLRERIARTNLATAQRIGIAELTRRLDDIRRDRDETYRRLGEPSDPSLLAAG